MGTPVAVLAENKEDVDKFKDFEGDGKGGGGGGGGGRRRKAAKKEEKPRRRRRRQPAEGSEAAEKETKPGGRGRGR